MISPQSDMAQLEFSWKKDSDHGPARDNLLHLQQQRCIVNNDSIFDGLLDQKMTFATYPSDYG